MDDESKPSERPTHRLGAIGDESSTSDEDERSADKPPASTPDDETKMLSRDELMENAVRDRDNHRQNKPTQPIGAVGPGTNSGETREMPQITETTAEVESCDKLDRPTDEQTRQYAREDLGIVDKDGQIGFPSRIEDDLRIPIPAALAQQIDATPGDIVVVKIQKVDD